MLRGEQRKAYSQKLKVSLVGESYSRVRYEEAIFPGVVHNLYYNTVSWSRIAV